MARVATGLRERGHIVEVWTVERGEGAGVRDAAGITVRSLPAPMPTGSLGGMWRFSAALPRAWRTWVAAHEAFRPTVLHVHCFGPNGTYALALNRRFRTPLMVTSHGETFMDDAHVFETSTSLRVALRAALTRAFAVTGPSRAVLADLTARFSLNGGVIVPNGVDLDVRPHASQIAGAYLFAVGRLGKTKGFDLLLSSFAEACLPNDVHLVIGGDGPQRDALEALAL
ncbi:MAG: glycosyltransferase, partial [Mycetocola sp.]